MTSEPRGQSEAQLEHESLDDSQMMFGMPAQARVVDLRPAPRGGLHADEGRAPAMHLRVEPARILGVDDLHVDRSDIDARRRIDGCAHTSQVLGGDGLSGLRDVPEIEPERDLGQGTG
jgi:hypothetical protein